MKSLSILLVYLMCIPFLFSQQEFSQKRILVKVLSTERGPNFWEKERIKRVNDRFLVDQVRSITPFSNNEIYTIQFESNVVVNEVIRAYLETGLFSVVEPDYIGYGGGKQMTTLEIPDDQYFDRQWGLLNDGSFPLTSAQSDSDIDMELAWDVEKGSSEIIVAILDSGVKLSHPEIKNRLWVNSEDSTIDAQDNDQNGYIDDINGWDFVNEDHEPKDDHGHGSNVTGIIGAEANNGMGYAGVDQNCRLMICKILDQFNSGFYSWWIEAIYYAVDNGAKVINMSVGGASYSSLMEDAVDYAHDNGVVVVACMMNFNVGQSYYPAGYQNTIAVGSTNPDDTRTEPFFWDQNSGSNFGDHIDLVAPGNYIYGLRFNSNTNYNSYWGGTSQSTPLVSGVASLLLAQDSTRTPEDIRNILNSTSEDLVGDDSDVPGWDRYYGHGRLNAHAALTYGTTSSKKANEAPAIQAFPNPVQAGALFTVFDIAGETARFKIFTQTGHLISDRHHSVLDGKVQFEVQQDAGNYFIHILQKNRKESIVRMLIIK